MTQHPLHTLAQMEGPKRSRSPRVVACLTLQAGYARTPARGLGCSWHRGAGLCLRVLRPSRGRDKVSICEHASVWSTGRGVRGEHIHPNDGEDSTCTESR